MNMTIKTHGEQEGDTDKKTENMIIANNHEEGGNVDMQEKMMTYNDNDVITNPKKQGASTYSIRTDMADKEPDVTSNYQASDKKTQTCQTTSGMLPET